MTTKTFHIANFGCRASQSEGASIQDELVGQGVGVSDSPYSANVVVVNSCTVTEEADRDVRQLIHRVSTRNPESQIIVTGCYAQRSPEEIAALPGVNYVVGNSHKSRVGEIALTALEDDSVATGRAEVYCSDIFELRTLPSRAYAGSGGRTRAVVKVQDGCNAKCSFCVIPSVRGYSRSMETSSVIAEIRDLVDREYKEVVLSGIHLGSWGRDLRKGQPLFDLVSQILDEVPGLERLRLSSIEPLEVTPPLISLVAREPRIAHHLHVPLQSGSNRTLRQMRRPYSAEYYAELVSGIRSQIEDAAIGADVMVGFPGESDEDFSETYRLIEESPLTYLHVFPYSARPGTPAAEMTSPVPQHVARFRSKALRKLIAGKNEGFRRKMIGRKLDALVLTSGEAISNNFIRIYPSQELVPNQWISLHPTELHDDGLTASL